MNGFDQIKGFYSWVFNNPDKIRPTHISLYLFLWNQANRANWVDWFKCPYDLAMQGACIGNKGTYYRCLDDLKEFKLIDYKKGINNFKAPLVHLIQLYKNEHLTEHLTEQVTVPLSEPQTVPLYVPQCEPQYVPIYKLITDNIKLITINKDVFFNFVLSLSEKTPNTDNGVKNLLIFDEFRVLYKGSKRGNETEFENFKKKHKDWKEVLKTLKSCLEKQIEQRKRLKDNGKFIPEWQNLQTYINQRSWEIEYVIENDKVKSRIKNNIPKGGW